MDTKQEIIRRYFREFDSVRKIARDLRVGRKHDQKRPVSICSVKRGNRFRHRPKGLQDYVSSPPAYDTQNRFKRKLTAEVEDMINIQLEDNQRKRQEGLRKQN